jgi:hypothetical protein
MERACLEIETIRPIRRNLLLGAAGVLLFPEVARAGSAAAAAHVFIRLTADPAVTDHGAMIQSAIHDVEQAGGGRIELAHGVYNCPSGPIYLDPTKTTLEGDRAVLDFSQASAAGSDAAGLIVEPPESATQYGQATQRIAGIVLRGPGMRSGFCAILFRAETPAYSSRIALYNVEVSDWQDGLRFEDRAYLIQIYSSTIRGCGTCVMIPPNLQDAGENITFYGCTMGAGPLAINNQAGFELNFFGTSFDFVDQWYRGDGQVNFYGCHFEKQKPVTAAPLFDVKGRGTLNFHGGFMMVSGRDFDPSPKNTAVFQLESVLSRVTLNDVFVYNLRAAGGALAAGPGRLVVRNLLGGSNREIDPTPLDGDQADLFGGTGAFAGTEILLEAAVYSDGADASAVQAHYGGLSVANGALNVMKTGGKGNEFCLRLFCPVAPLRLPSVRFQWQPSGSATDRPSVWVTMLAVQKIGQDPLGRARIGARQVLGPMLTLTPDFTGAADWQDEAIDTIRLPLLTDNDGCTSEWVTHLCLKIEMIELAENTGLLIRNLRAFAL